MKFNVSYPATGCQKKIEVDDEHKLRHFYDQRLAAEVDGACLGDDFKGYVFRIAGGNDKQGFPMKQGVLTSARVRLLLGKGQTCFRARRVGMRKRKSVRGCIVSGEMAVLNLVIVKKGDAEIPGLTDTEKPRRLGPKRANNIRKLFNLGKQDDVRKFVIRREIEGKEGKTFTKAPKIQRLITPQRVQRKRKEKAVARERWTSSRKVAQAYQEKVTEKMRLAKEARHAKHVQRRSMSRKKTADKK